MNYLGHFYLAAQTKTSFVGALLGDFVKGHAWQSHTQSEQIGILLHRQLDSWIDQWVIDEQLTALFPGEQRRYAPIALDLYWDYQLACSWPTCSSLSLSEFSQSVYLQLTQSPLPHSAAHVAHQMIEYDWLNRYEKRVFIQNALAHISQRIRRPMPVAALCCSLQTHHDHLSQKFTQLIDALHHYAPLWHTAARHSVQAVQSRPSFDDN
ncbi:acyl carrier protein phosphodiesterase [Celerinatantimonas yamalensis]|uniref:ACP phosphodiesterase n=1 Tax=Celerinatantimonas yamalensis TaxID=559956 RepID=A0ABW9G989_9GAMM